MITIDGFAVDATITQSHTLTSEITSHPVEAGADVSDHVRNMPIKFDCVCIVSNTPIGPVADLRPIDTLPSEDVYAHLLKIREAREPIVVVTPLQRYTNMLIESITIPVSVSSGYALQFTVSFKQVRFVSVDRTIVKVVVPRAKRKKNRGHKPTKPGTVAGAAKTEAVKTLKSKSLITKIRDLF